MYFFDNFLRRKMIPTRLMWLLQVSKHALSGCQMRYLFRGKVVTEMQVLNALIERSKFLLNLSMVAHPSSGLSSSGSGWAAKSMATEGVISWSLPLVALLIILFLNLFKYFLRHSGVLSGELGVCPSSVTSAP